MVLPTRLEKLMVRKTPDLRHYTAFILLLLSSGEANGGRRNVAVGSGQWRGFKSVRSGKNGARSDEEDAGSIEEDAFR
jgi:hypothetical protein